MTQPATEQPTQSQVSDELVTAVMVALAVGASIAATAATLAALLVGFAVTKEIAGAILSIMDHPKSFPALPNARRGAAMRTALDERRMRAWFLVNSSRRVVTRVRTARASGGTSPGPGGGGGAGGTPSARESVREALETERRYWQQHLGAQRKRREAADVVDAAVAVHGALLGWYSQEDSRTSPECRAAQGSNFRVSQRPAIGWPGSVHPRCRCKPGPPFATSRTVDSTTARFVQRGRVA